MNILFQCRKNLYDLSGGDKIQILKTKQALENKGVKITLSTINNPSLDKIDVLHLFNPSLLSFKLIKKAKAKNIPIVISTIHWDMKEYYQSILKINKEYLKLKPKNYLKSYFRNQVYGLFYNYYWYQKNLKNMQNILNQANVLLPNSQAEAEILKQQFKLNNSVVIPNGIDITIPQNKTTKIKSYKNFILCVGRIEYRKNQFLLLKSLMEIPLPLIFIGNNKFNLGYTSLCKKLAEKKRGKVIFIDHLPQDQLYQYYHQAKVHALISWYETPGLANLEAAYCGCNLAISNRGSVKEYFGEHAEYCDPNNLTSIKTAVLAAYHKPKTKFLKRYLEKEFTWEKAAAKTLQVYQSITTNKE